MKPKPKFNIIPIAGLALCLMLAFSLIQTVRRNFQLRGEVKNLESQISQLEEEKEDLAYRIQYYQTDSFKEKEARAKLGLQQPGEGVIILPKTESGGGDTSKTQERPKSNFKLWWEFLFG